MIKCYLVFIHANDYSESYNENALITLTAFRSGLCSHQLSSVLIQQLSVSKAGKVERQQRKRKRLTGREAAPKSQDEETGSNYICAFAMMVEKGYLGIADSDVVRLNGRSSTVT